MLLAVQCLVLAAVLLWAYRTVRAMLSWKRGGAPWVPTNVRAVGPLLERLIPHDALVWEVGAGDGRVAGYLARRDYHVTALELDRLLVAWGQVRFPRVTWVQGDLREVVIPKGAYIYAYLTPRLLEQLWRQLPRGCTLLALTFALPGVEAQQELEVPGWQGVLRVYKR